MTQHMQENLMKYSPWDIRIKRILTIQGLTSLLGFIPKITLIERVDFITMFCMC